MTNGEKDLLIAYLVDSGELDPDGDLEPLRRLMDSFHWVAS